MLAVLLPVSLLFLPALPLGSEVYQTLPQALKAAFPGIKKVKRQQFYLKESQLALANRLCQCKIKTRMVTRYSAIKNNKITGYAYLNTHRVRTLNETIMVTLDTAGSVKQVRILSFNEPAEYKAPYRFLNQFRSAALNQQLRLNRGIQNITGATLTAHAITKGVRRVLSLHQVLSQ